MGVSTLFAFGVWRIATLKALWFAAGEGVYRILAAILVVVSASWAISLVWICFSKSRQETIVVAGGRSRKAKYTGSTSAKAS
jgi:hypothetical protein